MYMCRSLDTVLPLETVYIKLPYSRVIGAAQPLPTQPRDYKMAL